MRPAWWRKSGGGEGAVVIRDSEMNSDTHTQHSPLPTKVCNGHGACSGLAYCLAVHNSESQETSLSQTLETGFGLVRVDLSDPSSALVTCRESVISTKHVPASEY